MTAPAAHSERMSRVDHAWLRMDTDANLMMIVGVWLLQPRLSLAELRERVGGSLLAYERFRQKVVEDPAGLSPAAFPFAAIKPIRIAGKAVNAFRISYVGEQGWELHMRYEDGLAVWDALRATGVMAVGVETYANSRRMEKSLRLQNADLLTEYNLLEADLARPKVKEADFRGKAKHLEYRARDHQPAMLCTLVMTSNIDSKGVPRYPVGTLPVMDPATGETLVDELGRRSFTTSIAYGPTIGKNIALAYLPWAYC